VDGVMQGLFGLRFGRIVGRDAMGVVMVDLREGGLPGTQGFGFIVLRASVNAAFAIITVDTNLTLKIHSSGASKEALVVCLLHRRRRAGAHDDYSMSLYLRRRGEITGRGCSAVLEKRAKGCKYV